MTNPNSDSALKTRSCSCFQRAEMTQNHGSLLQISGNNCCGWQRRRWTVQILFMFSRLFSFYSLQTSSRTEPQLPWCRHAVLVPSDVSVCCKRGPSCPLLCLHVYFSISSICWGSGWRCWCLVVRSSRSLEGSVHVLLASGPGPVLKAHTEKRDVKCTGAAFAQRSSCSGSSRG